MYKICIYICCLYVFVDSLCNQMQTLVRCGIQFANSNIGFEVELESYMYIVLIYEKEMMR